MLFGAGPEFTHAWHPGGVEQLVVAVASLYHGDAVVELVGWDVVDALARHGHGCVGFETGSPQHGNQQPGFVLANPTAVGVVHLAFVQRESLARSHGYARVAHVVGYPVREDGNAVVFALRGFQQFSHLLLYLVGGHKAAVVFVNPVKPGGFRFPRLSGGQQQRVFLARAMVKEPEILLLDEPATGIDSASKIALYDMLGEINSNQGVTIVMISHDLELAAQTAKSALCINHGICFRGEVQEALKHHHRHGYFYR